MPITRRRRSRKSLKRGGCKSCGCTPMYKKTKSNKKKKKDKRKKKKRQRGG